MPDEPLTIPEAPDPSADAAAYTAALEQYQEQLEQFKRETLAALKNRKSSEQEYDKLIVSLAGGRAGAHHWVCERPNAAHQVRLLGLAANVLGIICLVPAN